MVFLHQVAGESAKLYAAITDGIVNLVDKVVLGLVYVQNDGRFCLLSQAMKHYYTGLTFFSGSFLRCSAMMQLEHLKFIRSREARYLLCSIH